MFTRSKMQPVFPLETTMSNRQSMLSVVPELESPATNQDVSQRQYIPGRYRPISTSEITEILDELELLEDDSSDFEEDSDEVFELQSV